MGNAEYMGPTEVGLCRASIDRGRICNASGLCVDINGRRTIDQAGLKQARAQSEFIVIVTFPVNTGSRIVLRTQGFGQALLIKAVDGGRDLQWHKTPANRNAQFAADDMSCCISGPM